MWNQGPINEERDADLAILPVQDQNWHRMIRNRLEDGERREEQRQREQEIEREVERRLAERDRQREERINHEVERWITGANASWGVSEDGTLWDAAFEVEVDVRWRNRLSAE